MTETFQGLQWDLADVVTDLEAVRLLMYRVATMVEKGDEAIAESAHAKTFASRVAPGGVSQWMQAMGATGFRAETPVARHLATAKVATVG
ncbi:MAG: acyl-CoA dehydrogenase family protein [Candidatus Tectomicrobia bacterium]